MTRSTALDKTANAVAHNASPEHKRFHALLAKIDKARLQLQQWQEQLPLFAQAHKERVEPEQLRVLALRKAWALELETLLLGKRWSKGEQKVLSRLLLDICGALLEAGEEPDPELKALYNRHADVDFDSEAQDRLDVMKDMLERMSDLDLGDEPAASADDLLHRAQEQLAKRVAQEREGREGRAGREERVGNENPEPQQGPRQGHPRGPGRRPSKAQAAAQKRAEEDARQAMQTVREVYRKLAAALHPDRTAATASPGEHAERTALMQRANAAYEASDLLALLTLQLQIEQVNELQARELAASQVRHFNKVLAEQLREIEREVDARQHAFEASYGLTSEQRIDPLQLGRLLKEELRDVQSAAHFLAHERRMLSGEPVQAKRYIKQLRAEQRLDDEMGDLFF